MNEELLFKLSEADAIASQELEVRQILINELEENADEVFFDQLGSVIFHKKAINKNALKIMFCAHMDEVGFMVRHIDEYGMIYLLKVGGVSPLSMDNQLVYITTLNHEKIIGVLNTQKDHNDQIQDIYVDIGVSNFKEVKKLGIDIGDMVTFATLARSLSKDTFIGKSFDDRVGCYALIEAMKSIEDCQHDLYFVGTSSEEVGTRGGKTATDLVQPDIVFVIDVANHSVLDHGFKNHRKIGEGIMIVHYDKTLSPNKKLVSLIQDICKKHELKYQDDMLEGGGTDGALSHLNHEGKLALVLGIPLRYCHTSMSIVHKEDLEMMVSVIQAICEDLDVNDYKNCIDFRK